MDLIKPKNQRNNVKTCKVKIDLKISFFKKKGSMH